MRLIVVAILAGIAAQAQPADKQSQVDRIFSEFNNHTPGCAVGVAQNGRVVLQAGYGMADLERNVPITPASVFESGSVAKQFTAAALLLLAQQGKISLDDPVRKYLPELPDYGPTLTIRSVLSHVSGLREWRTIANFSGLPEGRLVYNNQDLLQFAARQKALNFDPGTHYSYTNTGFNLSTILIERALGNGKTFQDFTQENIFGPLAMTHTRWRDDYRTIVPNRALAYIRADEKWQQDTPIENIIGAGGLLTTIGDLLLWNENFAHPKVGGDALIKAQQTQAVLKSGRTITYAAGLVVSTVDGLREVSHGGATGGYRTWLGRYPDQSVSLAVLCNSAHANPVKLGRDVARLWTGAAAPKPLTSSYAPDPAKVRDFAGMYRSLLNNLPFEVKWQDGKLSTGAAGEMIPVAAGQFQSGETNFFFDDGPPRRMRMVTPDDETTFEKDETAHPSAAELAAFVGRYESSETASVLTIARGDQPDELTIRIGSDQPVKLRPAFRDSFSGPWGVIRFIRDSTGLITSLSASDGRTWDLRFARMP